MSERDQADTTRLLRDWAEGDRAALDILAPRVYKELRRIAGNLMRVEQGGRTLTATASVPEPGPSVMLGLGLAAVLLARRRSASPTS
jgi:hypothetical protein